MDSHGVYAKWGRNARCHWSDLIWIRTMDTEQRVKPKSSEKQI